MLAWARPPVRTARGLLLLNGIVLALYAVIGAATLLIGQYSGLASPVWPAAGLAFAAVYAWGWRVLPGIALGSLISNLLTVAREGIGSTDALIVMVAIALGAALQAYVGAQLVTKAVGPRASLSRGGQIIAFLIFAGPVGCLVNATVATVTQVAFGLVGVGGASLLWLTWWVGDSVGVIVFGPIALMLMPDQQAVWQGRRWRVAIPSLIAVGLFAAFFIQSELRSASDMHVQTERLANSAAAELQRNVARHQEVLEGLSSYFASSQEVTAEEFAQYTESALLRFPNLQALSWNPIVPAADRPSFEARQGEVRGRPDFTITERDADGNLVPATAREEYVAVEYIEPLLSNAAALGFDINSNPIRQEAIDTARETGRPSATSPIDLVQETGTQKGMLALVPVYAPDSAATGAGSGSMEPVGFAVGVYRLGDLLDDTFTGPRWNAADIRLIDVTTADEPVDVATRPAPQPPEVDIAGEPNPGASSDRFTVFGRTWQVEVHPTSGELAERGLTAAPSVEVVGLLVIFLLQAFVLLVTGLERQALRQAQRSEAEANTDHLTGLHNRRSFVHNLERVRERSSADGTVDSLLFLDLDGFKSVNDNGGHEAGDQLLQAVSWTLRERVRSRDTVARIGGDEFAIILNSCGAERAQQIADALVDAVKGVRVPAGDNTLGVGVSIGIVEIQPNDGLPVDELMRRADDACYQVKHQGGGALLYGAPGAPVA